MKRYIVSTDHTSNKLMRYIPKEYKDQVANIYEAGREWNDYTQKWNTLVTVEWIDGEENTYQNASYIDMMTGNDFRFETFTLGAYAYQILKLK